MEDLDDPTINDILTAEIPEEAERLNYLMDNSTAD
jgi:hypothetical protein